MAVLGRLALWACNPYSRRESGTQKHKTWFHSAVTVLKFLLILSLNLRFVSDIQWDNGVCIWAEEIHTSSCLQLFAFPVAPGVRDAPGHRIPVGSCCVGAQQDSEWAQGKCATPSAEWAWAEGHERDHAFLLQMQKEGNDVLRNTKGQGFLADPFLLCCFSALTPHLGWKWWHRRQGKTGLPVIQRWTVNVS